MKKLVIGAVAIFMSARLLGYTEPIHAKVTKAAFNLALGDVGFLSHLGLATNQKFAGNTAVEFAAQGAMDEDSGIRSTNHFLDPQNNGAALTDPEGLCLSLGEPADRWALDFQPLNAYGLPRAKDYFKSAITDPNPAVRDTNFRLLFESVGHMVHVVQDMAQPEHVRNDQHLPLDKTPTLQRLLGFEPTAGSLYETWVDVNLSKTPAPLEGGDAYFGGYAPVQLGDYRDYFHQSGPDGNGMADYTSRNFVTQDTNYDDEGNPSRCEHHSLPRISDATARFEVVAEPVLTDSGHKYYKNVLEAIYTSHPSDTNTQTQDPDAYHTLSSSIDLESKKYDPQKSVYSLADSSYQTRAALLLPRAVGYSAGFIEHFFRGKIDAAWTRNSGSGWDLTITNRSAEPIGPDAYLEAYYRVTPDLLGDLQPMAKDLIQTYVPGFQGLAPGASVTIPRLVNPSFAGTDCVNKFERRIFIRATLGNELGAVIGLVQAPDTSLSACSASPVGSGLFCYSGVGCGQAGELKIEATVVTPERDLLLEVDRKFDNTWTMDYACGWCDPNWASYSYAIPNSSVQEPVATGAARSITVQVAADSPKFLIFLQSFDDIPAPIDVAFRMFVNGQVVRQWTTTFVHGSPLRWIEPMLVSDYPCSGKEPPCPP